MLLTILWVMWGLVAPLLLALFVAWLLSDTESEGLIWAGAAVVVAVFLLWVAHLNGLPSAVVSWQSLTLACVCVLLVVVTIGATGLDWPRRHREKPDTISDVNR